MHVWSACGLLAVAALSMPGVARADFASAPDVVVYCDAALTAPMQDAARAFRDRTGVPVRVFPMTGDEMRGLVSHGSRNDVLVGFAATMDAAAQAGLIDPATRSHPWRDRIVLAARQPGGSVAGKRLAVPDDLPSSPLDGPTLASGLGAASVLGAPGIPDTAFLVDDGSADVALLPASAAGDLVTVAPLDAPPLLASAAISRNVGSLNSAAFVTYLGSDEAAGLLAHDGLERVP